MQRWAGKVLAFLLGVIVAMSLSGRAEESAWPVVGASTAALLVLKYGPPTTQGQSRFAHAGVGALAAGYVTAKTDSVWKGVFTAAAIGVAKELMDQHYDPHDAAATLTGGILGACIADNFYLQKGKVWTFWTF